MRKNLKKLIAMGLTAVMAVSVMSVSAFAVEETETTPNIIVVDENTPVGTQFNLGSGFVFEVIDEDTFNEREEIVKQMSMARAVTSQWEWNNLSGMNKGFEWDFKMKTGYPYYFAAIENKQSSSETTTLSVWTPTGGLNDSVAVKGGARGSIFNTSPLTAGTYKIRLVSGSRMEGKAYGYAASTFEEVATKY